jgi:hypothetical protein
MDVMHSHLTDVLSYFWEKQAVKISAFDTLSIVDWSYNYIKDLKNFGITDIFLQNGFNNMCNAYSRKIHCQINPHLITILEKEADHQNSVEEIDGKLQTNGPQDLIGVLRESFTIVIAKKI